MKKKLRASTNVWLVFQVFLVGGILHAQEETRMDLSFYTSTRGEMSFMFLSQWKFPFLRGESPLTADNNAALKLDTLLSPIWAGVTGNAVMTVFPFLSFNIGGMTGTGWNYDLFGKVPLVGLGLNRKTNADDPDDGVIGNGLDGIVWDTHAGAMVQFDLAAFFPGDWNHVVMQLYNEVQYLAYTKAGGGDFWYYLGDGGMNRNAFRYKFESFIGYMTPVFIDMVGFQFSGSLPFYNIETGNDVRDIGYSLSNAFIVNLRINRQFSIMAITSIANGLKDPVTSAFEREWGFDMVRFIATWRIK